MHLLFLFLPALIATIEGIAIVNDNFCRGKAQSVRASSKILFKRKLEKLKVENSKTQSALIEFGKERISVLKNELSEAEKILSKFKGKNVLEIEKANFPNEELLDDEKAMAFGAFGTQYLSRRFNEKPSFLTRVSCVLSGSKELEEALKFRHKTAVMRGIMDYRIRILVALRHRVSEGMKALKFLRGKLGVLLEKAKKMGSIDHTIFVQIQCAALTLKKAAEIEVCSVEGTLSKEAESFFNEILSEVA